MSQPRMQTVDCTDGLGRPARGLVELDQTGTKVVVAMPPDGGKFDWRQLDELIGVIVRFRQHFAGRQP